MSDSLTPAAPSVLVAPTREAEPSVRLPHAIEVAATRFGILIGRFRGCDSHERDDAHALSIEEANAWAEETADAIAALRTELASLRDDAARLDWLDALVPLKISVAIPGPTTAREAIDLTRAAIDAARASKPTTSDSARSAGGTPE